MWGSHGVLVYVRALSALHVQPKENGMAAENFAPYAPAKAVLAVLDRFRERGLPDPLAVGTLEQIGIPTSNASRTLQALRFLGLIDEGGNRLPTFNDLRTAKTEDYPGLLAEIVRAAYLPIFTIVNPAEDSDTALADAFRGYVPASQWEKMIALFRALCVRAEITSAAPTVGAPKRSVGGARPRPQVAKKPEPQPRVEPDRERDTLPRHEDPGVDIRLITAIIQQLPRERRWSTGRRDRWLAAITSAVDLLIEIGDDPPQGQ